MLGKVTCQKRCHAFRQIDLGGLMVHAGRILQARQESHDQVAGEPHGDQCQRQDDLRGTGWPDIKALMPSLERM